MTKYIRYRSGSTTGYAILDGETVRPISGGLFGSHAETGATLQLSGVALLAPCQPGKILAVGLNYKSHLGGRPQPTRPEIFYKAVTSLQDPGGPIVTPRDATDLHYEGELVAVIGQPVRNASVDEARAGILQGSHCLIKDLGTRGLRTAAEVTLVVETHSQDLAGLAGRQ